jgi:hypothetical protein
MAAFNPFEVNVPHLVYTILGAFIVLFGMFSLGKFSPSQADPSYQGEALHRGSTNRLDRWYHHGSTRYRAVRSK